MGIERIGIGAAARGAGFAAAAALMLSGPLAPAQAVEKAAVAPVSWKSDKGMTALRGVPQIGMGQFSVVFLIKKVDYDGGGFLSASSEGKAVGHLQGVSPAQMQSIADRVYGDFQSRLAAAGIAIASPNPLMSTKYWEKVKPSPAGADVFIMQKKKDKADGLAFFPAALGHSGNMMLQSGMFDFSMGAMNTASYMGANTTKIPIVHVVYVIDFAAPAQSQGGGIFHGMKVKAQLAVSPFGTKVQVSLPDGKSASATLSKAFVEGGDFARIEDRTGGVNKGIGTGLRVASAIFGGPSLGNMQRRFDYIVDDQAAFAAKVEAALGQANQDVIDNFIAAAK
jgi:hypothetical protein